MVESLEQVRRADVNIYQGSLADSSIFIKVRFRNETSYINAVSDLKVLIKKNDMMEDELYRNFAVNNREEKGENDIVGIHEYDIPHEIEGSNGLKCGKWYTIIYTGETHRFDPCDMIVPPSLRMLAFDIETTKEPLKFPDPKLNEIMMISILTERGGMLLTNREIVSKDVRGFEYSPKKDIKEYFDVYNEVDEESLLSRFIELVCKMKPHFITTYNGDSFDLPFVEERCARYGIELKKALGFSKARDSYISTSIIHLDCFRWVRRDSYLPMGSQGLKSVAKAKLGYQPDEIDPEDIVDCARRDPLKLASYSVSDAVATYHLFTKYVHPFIFSLCTLIPLPPHHVLTKGSGTLCESLLISECRDKEILIPPKSIVKEMYYDGHLVESLTCAGGHVECLKSGIYRADFKYDFHLERERIDFILNRMDYILDEYKEEEDYESVKNGIIDK
jgi:DNA polymerase epsilon subunit 1